MSKDDFSSPPIQTRRVSRPKKGPHGNNRLRVFDSVVRDLLGPALPPKGDISRDAIRCPPRANIGTQGRSAVIIQ
jgi:hypothetical protein